MLSLARVRRVRWVRAASSGLCVLSPFGYAVHPVVEGRIVDVAALGSVQEEAA